MARFAVGQTVETREPTIEVDPGMDPGRHRFQLVVVNEANVRSAPATAIVEIKRGVEEPRGPTPLPTRVVAEPAISRAVAPRMRTATPRKTTAPGKTTKPRPKKK
jgi:hypothetical protein